MRSRSSVYVAVLIFLLLLPAHFTEAQQQTSAAASRSKSVAGFSAYAIGEEQNVHVEFQTMATSKCGEWIRDITLSGFPLNDGMIVTAGHANEIRNLTRCPPHTALFCEPEGRLVVDLPGSTDPKRKYVAAWAYKSEDDDIMLLFVPGLANRSYPRLNPDVQAGERVYKTGNPLDFTGVLMIGHSTTGKITGGEELFSVDGVTRWLVPFNAWVNGGDSGAAVRNELGEVIGIVTAKDGKDLARMTAAGRIKAFLYELREKNLLIHTGKGWQPVF